VRRAHEDDALDAYEDVLSGTVRVRTRKQDGFFADKTPQAMGDEDEGT
jgi:hypothetical protein